MLQAIYKVPNGKLLKIFLEKDKNTIRDIQITGDFFVYPEEKITLLEETLRGVELEPQKLQQNLEKVIESEEMTLFGIDPESIVTAIFLAK